MGQDLNCLGHVTALKRLKSGVFQLNQAISLEKLLASTEDFRQNKATLNDLQGVVLPLADALDDIPAVLVSEHEARRLRQGQDIPLHPLRIVEAMHGAPIVVAKDALGLVALTQLKWEALQPVRVFNIQV